MYRLQRSSTDSCTGLFAQSLQAVTSRTICLPMPPESSGLTNLLRLPSRFQQAKTFSRFGKIVVRVSIVTLKAGVRGLEVFPQISHLYILSAMIGIH
jgi:hypothetical protein